MTRSFVPAARTLCATVIGVGLAAQSCGGSLEPAPAPKADVQPVACPAAPDLQSSFEGEDYTVIEKRVLEKHFEVHPKDCALPRLLRARVLRKGEEGATELWTVERCDRVCFDYRVTTRKIGFRLSPTVEPVEGSP